MVHGFVFTLCITSAFPMALHPGPNAMMLSSMYFAKGVVSWALSAWASSSSIFWILASVAGSPLMLVVALAAALTVVTVVEAVGGAWAGCWYVVAGVLCAMAKLAPRKNRAQADLIGSFMEHYLALSRARQGR